ncbi:MAG TPA: DUF4148 domain-containing protein [Roseateles sp.]|nr:DUF4148 domain-containing protein [Roseateles sp.]
MKTSILPLLFLVALGSAQAQGTPAAMPAEQDCSDKMMMTGKEPSTACRHMSAKSVEAEKMLAEAPTAAGPRPVTRVQVIQELKRARAAGEMDGALYELGMR